MFYFSFLLIFVVVKSSFSFDDFNGSLNKFDFYYFEKCFNKDIFNS